MPYVEGVGFRQNVEHESYLFDPSTCRDMLDLLEEIYSTLDNVVQFSSLNKDTKWRLSELAKRASNFIDHANTAEFDPSVHRAMLRQAKITNDGVLMSMDERKRLLDTYQKAIEFYISSLVGKKKA